MLYNYKLRYNLYGIALKEEAMPYIADARPDNSYDAVLRVQVASGLTHVVAHGSES